MPSADTMLVEAPQPRKVCERMGYSLNRVELIGNLGRDAEVRRTNSGDPVVNLRVATEERWRDKNTGEQQQKTEWHTVVVFGGLAKVAEQYCKKGTKIFVAGKLTTRKWQDQSGNDRYSTEVTVTNFGGEMILLGGTGERENDSDSGMGSDRYRDGPAPQTRQTPAKPTGTTLAEDLDDEIPF